MSRRGNLTILVTILALIAGTIALAFQRSTVLGLDLRGGAEVVLQAEPKQGQPVTQQGLDQAVRVLRSRVDSLGVSEPEIRKEGSNRISVALAGLKDPQRVLDLVGSTGQLYFLDAEGGPVRGVSISQAAGDQVSLSQVVPKTSLFDLLTAAQSVPSAKKEQFSAYYAFKKGQKDALNRFAYTSQERLALDPNVTPVPAADRVVLGVPDGTVVVSCSNKSPNGCPGNISPLSPAARKDPKVKETFYWYLYNLPAEADQLTGRDLDSAQADFDPQTGQPQVNMNFNDRGGRLFKKITKELADRGRQQWRQAGGQSGTQQAYFQHFAVILDGQLKTYPYIDFEQTPDGIGGQSRITGLRDYQEAKDIALVLQFDTTPTGHRFMEAWKRARIIVDVGGSNGGEEKPAPSPQPPQ